MASLVMFYSRKSKDIQHPSYWRNLLRRQKLCSTTLKNCLLILRQGHLFDQVSIKLQNVMEHVSLTVVSVSQLSYYNVFHSFIFVLVSQLSQYYSCQSIIVAIVSQLSQHHSCHSIKVVMVLQLPQYHSCHIIIVVIVLQLSQYHSCHIIIVVIVLQLSQYYNRFGWT